MGKSFLAISLVFSAALLLIAGCAGAPGGNSGNSSAQGAQSPSISPIFNQTSNSTSVASLPPAGNSSSSEPGQPPLQENISSQGSSAQPEEMETFPIPVPSNYSLSEIARHNSTSDCWAVLDSSIINITSFTSSHQAANYSELNSRCGGDITVGLENKIISSAIRDELEIFYYGRYMDADVYLGELSK